MTGDPALAHSLRELAGDNLTIRFVEDLRRLADELMQHGTAVALLDAQSLGVPADAAVDAVKSQFPDVRLMVAGYATEQTMLASRIAQQKVFRFVQKPASPQRLKLFLDAAALQRPERRAVERASAADAAHDSGSARPPRGGSALLPMLAAGVAVAIVAIGGWLLLREDGAAQVAASDPAAVARTAAAAQAAAVLARADAALVAGHLIAADGSSAAELYREALRLDADSTAAADGFARTIEAALTGAEQALLAGELEQSRISAELLRLIVPDNSRLAFLYTQIERELARLEADTTQRQALEARRTQIRAAADAVDERIAAGALLEPATNSAMSRFREAQAVGGGDPLVRGSRDALVGALLTAADSALDAGRSADAVRLVDAAGSVNSSASGLDIMRRRVAAALAPDDNDTSAAAAIAEPQPAEVPAAGIRPDPAPATGPANAALGNSPLVPPASEAALDGTGIVSAARLRTLRRVDPVFPTVAVQQLISGWVELEFTVAVDGSVKDVAVTESEPRRTFDSAALAAMRRYRYAPVLHDGQPVEQRARLRMRFTAQDLQ